MFRAAAIILILGVASIAEATEKAIWLAVGRPELVKGLKSLAEKRRQDGFEVIISTAPVGQAIREAGRRPAYLVLVGDDEAGKEAEPWYLAAKREKIYRWQDTQDREFASDAAWGDLDGDGTPDIPVGRIPARTQQEVEMMAGKILGYEAAEPTEDDLRLPMWGGSAEYGASIDALTSGMVLTIVRNTSPKWCVPWVVMGNMNSPLCGWSTDQPRMFTEQMRRGGMMMVLMGHASSGSFSSVNGVSYSFGQAREALAKGPAAPPMVMFSCHSGNFTNPGGCMTKSFVMSPGGPVAAIGATTVSHPLTNYYSGISLLKQLGGRQKRIGDFWMACQLSAMNNRSALIDKLLSDVEGKLDTEIDVERLRHDHLLMYALLGDPATKMRLPERLEVTVARKNGAWEWKATQPEGAKGIRVEFRADSPALPKLGENRDQAEMKRVFNETNKTFEYAELASMNAKASWSGKISKDGWVRFVAMSPKKMYVATAQLKTPEEASQ